MPYLPWPFLSFRGRIGRGLFWAACLANFCAAFLLDFLANEDNDADSSTAIDVVCIAVAVVLLVSAASVGAKRFHDRGKTAWLLLIPAVLFAISGGIEALSGSGLSHAIAYSMGQAPEALNGVIYSLLAALLIDCGTILWLSISLGIMPGDEGANRYGPAPTAKS